MPCNKCGSERVASLTAKCSDLCSVVLDDKEHKGYVPVDMGITDGDDEDYVDFNYCLDCGQIQGMWPRPKTRLEGGETDG